ncbi:uncharacterized protein LOC123269040 [Cotesia glomerata]|uniref:uncharacterized protein LOC123269040 n=1 Tax=Cotesia glomerata TaxID=32391 RepID=UPI001D02B86A|nr:uncharacterized protein LOC123269040 [Cotesia glomerata]
MAKKCFLCSSRESVIDFNENSFKNCVLKLAFRKEKNFKYNDVTLTSESLDFVGYHSACYSKVSVLKSKYSEEYSNFVKNHEILQSTSTSDKHTDSSEHFNAEASQDDENNTDAITSISMDADEIPCSSSASRSNNKITCLFCNHKQKKCGKQVLNLIFPQGDESIQQIKKIATNVHDSEILSKLENQTVAYHKSCYAIYQTKEKRYFEEHKESSWHNSRHFHKQAFESLTDFITDEIIENNRVMYLAQLLSRYKALLFEFGLNEIEAADVEGYRAEMLEKKLFKKFGDIITIEASTGPRYQKIVYKTDFDVSIIANTTKFLENENANKFQDVAFYLRHVIKNIDHKPLPQNLTAEDVIRGECEIPPVLFDFIQNLITGPDIANADSNETTVKITSICSDIIYAVSKGRCKPNKNLTLGLAVKSLTNSRQVLTILNKYGHTIGYNLAEELETEMTYTSVQHNTVIPTGITAASGCSTHVAFDNFDRFVETSSGKDTMHDTVGIIYQFPFEQIADPDDVKAATSSTLLLDDNQDVHGPQRKRRRFAGISREIRPYYSKPTTCMQLFTKESFVNTIDECKGATMIATEKDLLWVMSLLRKDSAPMWLGYNCTMSSDPSPIQNIEYLPPINSSPTSYAVVQETLITAKEIAEKCQQEQIIVTYDLAIAKMAMQIQESDKPKFNNIFINMGAFHMQMAFFKAIGSLGGEGTSSS